MADTIEPIQIYPEAQEEINISNNTIISIASTAFSNGSFVLVWKELQNSTYSLYVRTYDATGTPISPSYLIDQNSFIANARIQTMGDTSYTLAWSNLKSYNLNWQINIITSSNINSAKNIPNTIRNASKYHDGKFEFTIVSPYFFISYFVNQSHVTLEKLYAQTTVLLQQTSINITFSKVANIFINYNKLESLVLAINSPDHEFIYLLQHSIKTLQNTTAPYLLREPYKLMLMDAQSDIILLGLNNNLQIQHCLGTPIIPAVLFSVKLIKSDYSVNYPIMIKNSDNRMLGQINILSNYTFSAVLIAELNATIHIFNFRGEDMNTMLVQATTSNRAFKIKSSMEPISRFSVLSLSGDGDVLTLSGMFIGLALNHIPFLFQHNNDVDPRAAASGASVLAAFKILPPFFASSNNPCIDTNAALGMGCKASLGSNNEEGLSFGPLRKTADSNNTLVNYVFNSDAQNGIWRHYNYDRNLLSIYFDNSNSGSNTLILSQAYTYNIELLLQRNGGQFYVLSASYSISDTQFKITATPYTAGQSTLSSSNVFSYLSPDFYNGAFASIIDHQNNIIIAYMSAIKTMSISKVSASGVVSYTKTITTVLGYPIIIKLVINTANEVILAYGIPIEAKIYVYMFDSSGYKIPCYDSTPISAKFSSIKLSIVNPSIYPQLFAIAWQNNYGIPYDKYGKSYYVVLKDQCKLTSDFKPGAAFGKEIINAHTQTEKVELQGFQIIDKKFLLASFIANDTMVYYVYKGGAVWKPKTLSTPPEHINPAIYKVPNPFPSDIKFYYQTLFTKVDDNGVPPTEKATTYLSYEADTQACVGSVEIIRFIENEY